MSRKVGEERAYRSDLTESIRAERFTALMVLVALALTGGLVELDLLHLI
ncbi:MAG TPA: hypothetical protein VG298_05280 [Acidimicrobiales bacterium]|jgi:hypothetical protein|nr:hypothetical protein [Acidimicrobiales bacterium]